jgi:hypothetical protein
MHAQDRQVRYIAKLEEDGQDQECQAQSYLEENAQDWQVGIYLDKVPRMPLPRTSG